MLALSIEKNLLFGTVALQLAMVSEKQLVEATKLWNGESTKSLANILVEQKHLSLQDRSDLDKSVDRILKKHQGNVRASLADLANPKTLKLLAFSPNPEIRNLVLDLSPYDLVLPMVRKPALQPPDLSSQGREFGVTVLFARIQDYLEISLHLSATLVCELIRDVMQELSQSVLDYEGVVVNYVGDALFAMWNAPESQDDHVSLACRAGLDMLKKASELGKKWNHLLKKPLRFGIGLNTGKALDPLDHTVNLASRVEGMTKFLGTPMLITEQTYQLLIPASFSTRYIRSVNVNEISEITKLYEIRNPAQVEPAWIEFWQAYEKALAHFENREFSQAHQILLNMLAQQNEQTLADGPTLSLFKDVVKFVKYQDGSFDPVSNYDFFQNVLMPMSQNLKSKGFAKQGKVQELRWDDIVYPFQKPCETKYDGHRYTIKELESVVYGTGGTIADAQKSLACGFHEIFQRLSQEIWFSDEKDRETWTLFNQIIDVDEYDKNRPISLPNQIGKILEIKSDGSRVVEWRGGKFDQHVDVIDLSNFPEFATFQTNQWFQALLSRRCGSGQLLKIHHVFSIEPPIYDEHSRRKFWNEDCSCGSKTNILSKTEAD